MMAARNSEGCPLLVGALVWALFDCPNEEFEIAVDAGYPIGWDNE